MSQIREEVRNYKLYIEGYFLYIRKRLFAGGPPANKNLFAGGPPANKNLFAGGLFANKTYLLEPSLSFALMNGPVLI